MEKIVAFQAKDGNIYYDYIKNVSFDEDKAKSLYPDAEVDMSLRGSKSFVVSSCDSVDNGCFKYGMYKGERFEDCNDTDYMLWYANNGGDCIELSDVLEGRGYVYYDGRYVSKEEYYRTLPVLNGKGVVVKGKNIEVSSGTVVGDKNGFHVIVGDFRILKK